MKELREKRKEGKKKERRKKRGMRPENKECRINEKIDVIRKQTSNESKKEERKKGRKEIIEDGRKEGRMVRRKDTYFGS